MDWIVLIDDVNRNEFEWKREECFMLRKPDPPVLVAVTKEPAGRIKTSTYRFLTTISIGGSPAKFVVDELFLMFVWLPQVLT